MTALLVYLACGAVAGILAGLLGVGGGIVIVPMLVFIFPKLGMPAEYVQLMALGTSLASIMITSVASFRAHNKRGAVRWDIWRIVTPGILIGTFGGGFAAALLPTLFLKTFFVCFIFYVAVQMLLDLKPKPSRQLPGPFGASCVGGVIGLVSSFVGIGGGTLSVPFLTFCNVPMHTAVGTSAAIGFPIAVAGTASYVWNGLHAANLPDWSLGYVSLIALAGLASASFITAPLGVRLAHSLPVPRLKRFFGIFLLIMGARMLWALF